MENLVFSSPDHGMTVSA